MENSVIFKILDSYFQDNPQRLVAHHIESYNDFFKNGIYLQYSMKASVLNHTNKQKTLKNE